MRKLVVAILVLAAIFAFSSVKDELLKTRENVRREIEGTREEVFSETRGKVGEEKNDEKREGWSKINLKKCCNQDGDWVAFILFDPSKLADFLENCGNDRLNEKNITLFLALGNCIYSSGKYTKDLGDIYDYEGGNLNPWEDHTIKEFAGFVLTSSTEVVLTVESTGLKNGDSVIGFEKNALFDFLRYFAEKEGEEKIWDILTSLPEGDDYREYVKEFMFNKKGTMWKSKMILNKEESFVKNPYLWIYTWWLDLNISKNTKAGKYSGEIVITISPKNVIQGG